MPDIGELIFPWLTLAMLFAAPFVDLRRPFRLLHLDLIVILIAGLGPQWASFAGGQPIASLLPTLIGLGYLGARLLHSGFRPRASVGPLVPHLSVSWLLVALVVVMGVRFGYVAAAENRVQDVGLATVAGADRIGIGDQLYGGPLDETPWRHTDTYGPVTYLAYVPFEQALPWEGDYKLVSPGDPAAAQAATIAFDLLVIAGLFLLGRGLRPGPEGRMLGLALAYAWASFPYTLFQIFYSYNDALVSLLVLGSFLALPYAAARGALSALATASKFGPIVLAPLLATGTGERPWRARVLFTAAFAFFGLAVLLPLLPAGGIGEFWDQTLGYQQGRAGANSLWSHFPELDWLQTIAQGCVVALALLLAFVPRRRSPVQLAALGAGLMATMQLTMTYWFSAYILWFAPLALAAFFAPNDCRVRSPVRARQPSERPPAAIGAPTPRAGSVSRA